MSQENGRQQVDREFGLDLLKGNFGEVAVQLDAGIVDEYVDVTESANDLRSFAGKPNICSMNFRPW